MKTWTEKCPTCAGTGLVLKDATTCNRSPTPNALKDCPNCNGNGVVTMWEAEEMTEKIITPIEVRLTIDSMKHSIVRYFMDYEGQVQEAILKATTEYLDKVNFTSLVQKELQPLLQEHIRSRIKDYLREAIDKTIGDKAEEAVASLFEKAKNA